VAARRHTDVVTLEGEGKSRAIKVSAARDIIASTQQAPYEGRAHLVIVDPADRMMDAAANALLKTFEEPREGVHYALIAENLSDVIDTVISRCTVLALGQHDDATTRKIVESELVRRDLEISPEQLDSAIELSDGRPGRALELASDPSLRPLADLLAEAREAAKRGPAAIFAGDGGPLWSAWKSTVRLAPDPDLGTATQGEPGEDPGIIVVKGKKSLATKKKKVKAKSAPAWGTPLQQRQSLRRLAELWLLHLRRELRESSSGLRTRPLVKQIQLLQALQSSLDRNPNVRLAFEQVLLEMHAA
jgi:DNA polymerase-3 subunit delta'